jgi:catechol 2,3-dioxygenase-like lactoylglutathione lyase family enzyme
MLDHMGIGASDFDASRRFYDAALAPLGMGVVTEVTAQMSGSYHGVGYGRDDKPVFWVSSGGARGTGIHLAFSAATRAEVDAFYAAGMASGGRNNGPPGLRPHYHPGYYGAFLLDPDGINVEAVCHTPE